MKRSKHLFCVVLLLSIALIGAADKAVAEDPALRGPYEVVVAEYDFGDSAFQPSNFPIAVEVRARVHYPSRLDGGPFPLVIFLHGINSSGVLHSWFGGPFAADEAVPRRTDDSPRSLTLNRESGSKPSRDVAAPVFSTGSVDGRSVNFGVKFGSKEPSWIQPNTTSSP